jgi:hypothetical protein
MKRFALILIIVHLVIGCSATRLHDKAIQKGYVHTIDIDTVKVPYLVLKNIKGKDSLIIEYRDSIVPKIVTEYVPRWRVRFDNKRFADSLASVRAMYKDSLRNALKAQKIALQKQKVEAKKETKKTRHENKKGANLFLFGLVIGIILTLIVRYAANQALKKFT